MNQQTCRAEKQVMIYKDMVAELEEELTELQQNRRHNTKYQRVKFQTNQDYLSEVSQIPPERSTRWINNVQYQLCAEADCLYLSGHSRSDISTSSNVTGHQN